MVELVCIWTWCCLRHSESGPIVADASTRVSLIEVEFVPSGFISSLDDEILPWL